MNNQNKQTPVLLLPSFASDSVTFSGIAEPPVKENKGFVLEQKDFERANKYLKENIYRDSGLVLDELDGIQYGIKVFEGLSMKEIAYAFSSLKDILAYRGCGSRCSDCYINAVPQHVEKNSEMIKQMAWEDFTGLLNGFKSIQNKLGDDHVLLKSNRPYAYSVGSFADADCIELSMKDSKGKVYDFVDIADLIFEKIEKQSLFDTSGWTPSNIKLQQRAERFVNYFSKEDNWKKMEQINISINPYHGLLEKALQFKENGQLEKALNFRNRYTDRIANAIFTFTPVMHFDGFHFLTKATSDENALKPEYGHTYLDSLTDEIRQKVLRKYKEDFASEQKVVKSKKDYLKLTKLFDSKINDTYYTISGMGRAKNVTRQRIKLNDEDIGMIIDSKFTQKVIDVDGRVHLVHGPISIPTEIQFNFANKELKAPPIGEVVQRSVTKNQIKKLMDYI